MGKIDQILRVNYIVQILRQRKDGASYKEIENFLGEKFSDWDFNFSPRTFIRDKQSIKKIAGIEIAYSRSKKTYYISHEELEGIQENIFDTLLLIEAYRQTKDKADVMFFEKRKAKGLEHLHGIIHAISNRKIINFKYQKFWETEKSKKVISPYALKEFKNRWYVLGTEFNHNNSDFKIKSYGLDRISDLEISSTKFIKQKINIEEIYKNSFGIFNTEDSEPQEIILSFDREQANYIKALKLHDSQEIISDDLSQTTFKVYLVPTYDFQREILSYGNRIKIISPESLKSIIKKEVKSMLENLD